MWNEAAISMDAATRVEKRYMKETLTFPFDNWNYGHNRNYLSYIQEQLGMADAAIFGARQLIDAPLDPERNDANWRSSHSFGIFALARALCKFERWDEFLDGKTIPWRADDFRDKAWKSYFEARAWLAKGDEQKAAKSLERTGEDRQGDRQEQGFPGRVQHPDRRVASSAAGACARRDDQRPGAARSSGAARVRFPARVRRPAVLSGSRSITALGDAYLKSSSARAGGESLSRRPSS